ncbi:MAG: DUF4276 family protein [Desulfovibrionales bacterium]|nr:DUF4276 family protein [Desulfovibrionales bacterium]
MTEIVPIHLAVEDDLSEAVMRRILQQCGRSYYIGSCYSQRGFGYLKRNVKGFNNAAKGTPFLILTDLDRSECAPTLISEWISAPIQKNLLFRVAVRTVEAWLLADRTTFARFMGLSEKNLPENPDELEAPKQFLVELAQKCRKRQLRQALAPPAGSTAKVGPDYNGKLIAFVQELWSPNKAAKHSPSLYRTVKAVSSFQPVYGDSRK